MFSLLIALVAIPWTAAVSFVVPSCPPANASPKLVSAPIGVSIEFFAFPGYMNLTNTNSCLDNFKELTGAWPPLRVGGTTQDRATYNESLEKTVDYYVADPKDAPASLTFGPSFMTLAGTYPGRTIIGLNRQLNQLDNTIAAAKQADAKIDRLEAIELGNEPNFYGRNLSSPINTNGGNYTPIDDYTSQIQWQASVATALNRSTSLISAGVYFDNEGLGFNTTSIAPIEAESGSIEYVRDFCEHNYVYNRTTADLAGLMNHSKIAEQIRHFGSEIEAAHEYNKSFIIGETNSATQGGGGISPQFGAGLWIVDYVFQLLHLGVEAIYFHQGTIGNCPYCWWGPSNVNSTYYGAYFATLALAGADEIAPLDDFDNAYGAWAIYSNQTLRKVLLYNSDFYNDTSEVRSQQDFTLSGLKEGAEIYAVRLTAPSATSETSLGEYPSVGGQMFDGETCRLGRGALEKESKVVDQAGWVTFTVAASEATIVYIQ